MAQQKKTDTHDAFKTLTPLEREFVVNAASGLNNVESYKAAGYAVENMSPNAIRVEACRIRQRPNIALILDALEAEKLDAAKLDLEEHLRELDRLAKRAELAGNYGAAVQAQQLRGKAKGLYVDQTRDLTPDNPFEILEQIAEHNRELAISLAEQKGLDWKPSVH